MTSSSSTTTEGSGVNPRIPLPHPGEVLREEFLEPMGLSVYALAKAIHVTRSRVMKSAAGVKA